jgi:hypothetical protein
MARQRPEFALFMELTALGLIGCLLGAPFSIAVLNDPAAGGPIDPSTVWVRALLEALLILVPASAVGLWLGRRVGLGAVYPAMLGVDTTDTVPSIRRTLRVSLVVGVAIASPGLIGWLFIPQSGFGPGLANPTQVEWLLRSISAAITEEIAFRFGLVTLLVWAISAVVRGASRERAFWVGNAIAALVFAGAHLPPILSLDAPNWGLVALVVVFNGLAGIAMGWLFARYSLLAAMIAHATADILQHVIPRMFT